MKKFKLEIDTRNAAFDDEPITEVARMLRELADRLELNPSTKGSHFVFDLNGNPVGTYKAA